MPPLRVGIVDYLNSRPLAWAFRRGIGVERFEPAYLPPAQVAERLAAGGLEIGLVPSIEAQRIGGLRLLPDLCVAATREVRSVLLVSRRPPEAIRRLALDRNSRTSAALVRILLREGYGAVPECVEAAPRLEEMLARADAALLIGDPALRVAPGEHRVLDLAAEWRRLTGLPFVFAVWAVRPEVREPGLGQHFRNSLELGLAEMELLARQASEELGLSRDAVVDYLTRNLRFRLGDEELAGLEEFYRRARVHGLLDRVEPLRFYPEA